jgi:hypothetical protein
MHQRHGLGDQDWRQAATGYRTRIDAMLPAILDQVSSLACASAI